jgi:large subunit ribosomal protein L6
MSRIGRLPIGIPSGVTVTLEEGILKVTGPKGSLQYGIMPGITLEIGQKDIQVNRADNHRTNRALHGLTRSLINNLIIGVTKGFERVLDIVGVGYRAEVKDSALILNIGYSHLITFSLPEHITAKVDKQNRITIEGCDKQKVGETAAKIRAFRPPEPYKGKGIKFAEERIRRKVGKSGAK